MSGQTFFVGKRYIDYTDNQSDGCRYGICYGWFTTGYNYFGGNKLYDNNNDYNRACHIMPVVTLDSNLVTSGQDSNGVWQISQ